MTSSFGRLFRRATILRASSNGQACDCSASARRSDGFSAGLSVAPCVIIRVQKRIVKASPSKNHPSKRADREIAQPQIRVAALFPKLKKRPVQGKAQKIVAALDRDADALAEIAAFQERTAAERAAAGRIRAIEPEGERNAVAEQQIDVLAAQRLACGVGIGIGPHLGLG